MKKNNLKIISKNFINIAWQTKYKVLALRLILLSFAESEVN